MKSGWKTYYTSALPSILIGVLTSGFIGMAVALPFVLDDKDHIIAALGNSFLVAVGIAVLGSLVFSFAYRNVRRRTIWAFIGIAATIAVGTPTGAYLMGFRSFIPILLMIALAESAGLLLTYTIYRYTNRLNERLEITQQEFTSKKND